MSFSLIGSHCDPEVSPDELLLQAFVDGELDPAERDSFRTRLHREPDLRRGLERLQDLHQLVQVDRAQLPPHPYPGGWRIALAGEGEPGIIPAPGKRSMGILSWIGSLTTQPWFQPAAVAATLLIAVLVGLRSGDPAKKQHRQASSNFSANPDILSVDLPQEGSDVYVYQIPDTQVTILWVTGLPELTAQKRPGEP